jgi:hypothetical protein
LSYGFTVWYAMVFPPSIPGGSSAVLNIVLTS